MNKYIAICLLALIGGNAVAQDSLGIRKVGSLYDNWDSVAEVAFYGDYACLALVNAGFRIVKISGEDAPEIVSSYTEQHGWVQGVKVDGDRAYLLMNYAIKILDISDPYHPTPIGEYQNESPVSAYEVENGLLFISINDRNDNNRRDRFTVYDVSNPDNIHRLGEFRMLDVTFLQAEDDRVYYGTSRGRFGIVDVENPNVPVELGHLDTLFSICSLSFYENMIYLDTGRLRILDVTDPTHITIAARMDSLYHFKISDDIGFSATLSPLGISTFDLSDPSRPEHLETYETASFPYLKGIAGNRLLATIENHSNLLALEMEERGHLEFVGCQLNYGRIEDVIIDGDLAITEVDRGLTLVDISDVTSPRELSYLSFNRLNLTQFGSTYKIGSKLFILYHIAGGGIYGKLTIDISNPLRPEVVADDTLENQDPTQVVYVVEVQGDIAYGFASGRGMVVIDYSDPLNPVEIGQFQTDGISGSLCLDQNTVYLTSKPDDSHLRFTAIDISNPSNPTELGHFDQVYFQLRRIVASQGILTILELRSIRNYNFTDPADPQLIGSTALDRWMSGIFAINNDYVACADGGNGLRLFKNRDEFGRLVAPREVAFCRTPGWAVDVTIRGTLAFVADRTNLGIYDISEAIGWQGVEPAETDLPQSFSLLTPYPNPFNSTVNIRYQTPVSGELSLKVFDLSGREVANLLGSTGVTAGRASAPAAEGAATVHSLVWKAESQPSGIYFCRMETQGFSRSVKLLLVK